MRKAGGVVAIISGLFGAIAAIITIAVGGIGEALADDDTILIMGVAGLGISFLVIALGALALFVNSRIPGILLMVSALAGALAGGTLVAIFMIPAFVAGVLALFTAKTAEA